VDEQETLAQIIERDRNDQERTIAPLVMAEDAILVDSSRLNADEVVARMLEIISLR
jgi:cytidylate kinase